MFCKNCGTNCQEGSMTCTTCGAPLYATQQQAPQYTSQYQPQQASQYAPQPMSQEIPGKGIGAAAMILGLGAVVLLFMRENIWVYLSLACAVVGLVLSACGLYQTKKVGKVNGMAITGLVCSVAVLALMAVSFVLVLTIYSEISGLVRGMY